MSRFHPFPDFGVHDLEKQSHLSGRRIPDFGDLVARSTDFHGVFLRYNRCWCGSLEFDETGAGVFVLGFFGGAAGEVGLVLFALGVGEVGAFVGVEGKAAKEGEGRWELGQRTAQ